jgi:hypothetical protein
MNRELMWALLAAALAVQGCKEEEQVPVPEQPKKQAPAPAPGESPPSRASPSSATRPDQKAPEGCNSDFAQRITVNHTLTEKCSPYTLTRTLSVEGWELTIEPGVEIQVDADQRIEVGYNAAGRLLARGTAEKPIRFVSRGRKEPGAWRGIVLFDRAGGSVLEHVVLEHAGRDNGSALENRAAEVRVKNVRFVGVKGRAFQEEGPGARTVEFADNDLTGAGGEPVLARLRFENTEGLRGNTWPAQAVVQLEGDIQRDLQVPNPGVPYRVRQPVSIEARDENGTASVKVAPGVVFQMNEDVQWTIGYSRHGHLEAVGTAEQPIVFTGFGDAKAGEWKGLTFYDKARAPTLEHVRFEHGGRKENATLRYNGTRGLGKLTHVTVRKSAGHAVWATGQKTEGFTAFSDNTFEEIGKSTLRLDLHLASGLGTGNTYPQGGAIEIEGRMNGEVVLTAQGAPYRVTGDVTVDGADLTKPAKLTIEPGAVLQFEPEGRLNAGYSGPAIITAVGTAEKPITFTALTQGWKGMVLYAKAQARFEHAVVEKVTDGKPALHFYRGVEGGAVKNVLFKDVKAPIRNCIDARLTVEDVKAEPSVPVASRTGC